MICFVAGMPLTGLLVLTQVLNAIVLLSLLVWLDLLARDPRVMGRYSVVADLPPLPADHWANC
jgi:Mn2+/Fe2+ NRAMP family transporter